jgi:CRP-like cAMP-binding protein
MAAPEASQHEQSQSPVGLVRVLDADPDLGANLQGAELQRATNSLVARVYNARPGPWEIRAPAPEAGAVGLLVLDGLLGLRTAIEGRATLELVGRGDLLQPWVQLGSEVTLPPDAGWRVFEPSQVILLDRRFVQTAAEWPEVMTAVMYRLVLRSRRLCYQLAVNTSPRAEDRVLYMLWALADRWGRVTEDGVVLRLSLNHEQIAELVSAQRPSVSAALSRLRKDGCLAYSRGSFILCGDPPAPVKELEKQVALRV